MARSSSCCAGSSSRRGGSRGATDPAARARRAERGAGPSRVRGPRGSRGGGMAEPLPRPEIRPPTREDDLLLAIPERAGEAPFGQPPPRDAGMTPIREEDGSASADFGGERLPRRAGEEGRARARPREPGPHLCSAVDPIDVAPELDPEPLLEDPGLHGERRPREARRRQLRLDPRDRIVGHRLEDSRDADRLEPDERSGESEGRREGPPRAARAHAGHETPEEGHRHREDGCRDRFGARPGDGGGSDGNEEGEDPESRPQRSDRRALRRSREVDAGEDRDRKDGREEVAIRLPGGEEEDDERLPRQREGDAEVRRGGAPRGPRGAEEGRGEDRERGEKDWEVRPGGRRPVALVRREREEPLLDEERPDERRAVSCGHRDGPGGRDEQEGEDSARGEEPPQLAASSGEEALEPHGPDREEDSQRALRQESESGGGPTPQERPSPEPPRRGGDEDRQRRVHHRRARGEEVEGVSQRDRRREDSGAGSTDLLRPHRGEEEAGEREEDDGAPRGLDRDAPERGGGGDAPVVEGGLLEVGLAEESGRDPIARLAHRPRDVARHPLSATVGTLSAEVPSEDEQGRPEERGADEAVGGSHGSPSRARALSLAEEAPLPDLEHKGLLRNGFSRAIGTDPGQVHACASPGEEASLRLISREGRGPRPDGGRRGERRSSCRSCSSRRSPARAGPRGASRPARGRAPSPGRE